MMGIRGWFESKLQGANNKPKIKFQMKNYTMMFVVFLASLFMGYGQTTTEFFDQTDAFLAKHVKDGRVDYKAIKKDSAELDSLLQMAESISVSKDNAKEYQAFWINAFNLLVIRGVVKVYPIKTILDISDYFETPLNVGGINIILNDIENKLLRESFPSEPRFHFVLSNAALNNPPIINAAYRPSTLDAQMEKQTQLALNDADYIRVHRKSVELPMMFDWYKEDFTRDGKSLADFINQYRSKKLHKKAKVSLYSYDFTLNDVGS